MGMNVCVELYIDFLTYFSGMPLKPQEHSANYIAHAVTFRTLNVVQRLYLLVPYSI
jgi:hypothetical protein